MLLYKYPILLPVLHQVRIMVKIWLKRATFTPGRGGIEQKMSEILLKFPFKACFYRKMK